MKKMIMSFAAVALIVAGSAFKPTTNAAGDIYGNKPSEGDYERLSQSYNPLLCQDNSENACIYTVTEAGAPFVTGDSYTDAQLQAFSTLGYVTASSERGIYNGN